MDQGNSEELSGNKSGILSGGVRDMEKRALGVFCYSALDYEGKKGNEMIDLTNYANVREIKIIREEHELYHYLRPNENEIACFEVGCIFKSFLAVLVGIAIYEGKIHSIDDCVMDYISH